MTAFYKNYVTYCAKVGKSLSAVAEEVGLSRTSPNGWKKGKLPRDSTLAKLAEHLNCSVQDLLSENENKPVPEGNELNIETVINNMSREQLIEFIMLATARLKDME